MALENVFTLGKLRTALATTELPDDTPVLMAGPAFGSDVYAVFSVGLGDAGATVNGRTGPFLVVIPGAAPLTPTEKR